MRMLQVFRTRRMFAVLMLGFSSGLPFFLTGRTLQAWLSVEKVDLTSIGLFSLAGLPYSLKFLWAPLADRFTIPFTGAIGRRKGWLVVSQAALAITIAAMAFHDPSVSMQWLAINALALAFFSATQDITVDAYRADILQPDETPAGAGVSVLGYRVALVLTGAFALVMADILSWNTVYLLLGGLMAVLLLVSARIPEPPSIRPPQNLSEAVRLPFVDYFQRQGNSKGSLILGFIILFRLGDSMIANMTTPFLLQVGFTQTDVGTIQGGVGLITTIIGVLAGGAIGSRLGLFRSLWIFGGLQALSNLAYVYLASSASQSMPSYRMLVATIVVENFCTGLGTSALVGFLMSLCNPRFSATQYALLSSVMAVGRDLIVAPVGKLVEMMGWTGFFWISFVAAFPALLFLPRFAPWRVRQFR